MPIKLNEAEINELQKKYSYLTNYESDDPTSPINPLTYIDSNGDHLLHIAAQSGDIKTITLLIKAGVDINQQGDMGYTALHYAKMKNLDDISALLLSHGARSIRNEFGELPDDL